MSDDGVQGFLNEMQYFAHNQENYRISSPKYSLNRRSAMCMDGSLLAAKLTGRRPEILFLQRNGRNHAALLLRDGRFFGAISKSSVPSFRGRQCEFDSINDLAKSHEGTIGYRVIMWDEYFPDWETVEESMMPDPSFWEEDICSVH